MTCVNPDKPVIFNVQHLDDEMKTIGLQANGKYCGKDTLSQKVVCDLSKPEAFQYQKIGQGRLTLRSNTTKMHCADDGTGYPPPAAGM
jgi:hypothetical protein